MARRSVAQAKGLISYFTRHHTAANLVLVLLIVAGLFSTTRIRAQFFPDVVIQEVTVSVAWAGAGAEDVDQAIVQVLEPVLQTVEGVTDTSARATEGNARVTLEFEAGYDMARATEDVQTAVDAVRNLPEEAEDPVVRRNAWRDRVTDVVITGPVAVDQLGRFADELVTRLFAEGVTRTTITGVAAPEIMVEVGSASLIRHDLSMSEIAQAIAAQTQAAPAGDVSGGSARVRTGTARRSADDIASIVLRSAPDGTKLTIGDVGTIRSGGLDRDRALYVGANPAVTVTVERSDLGDAIRLQAKVQKVADTLQLTLPADVTVQLVRTRAEQITDRLKLLLDNGAMGLALVVALLFLFLNARRAFWVAAGIPVAMMAAIAAMYAAGLTLNMMSLFALIITLGIVVDDAIVVGEHADFRARVLREDPVTASENAARRMASPVVASTLTTVIAFFALVAIGGRFGNLIVDIPFTVIAVLMASLLECFLILPNHMAHTLAHAGREHWYDWPSRTVNRGLAWLSDKAFRPLVSGVIVARYPVLALAIFLLVSQVSIFVRGDLQWRFFNSPEQGSVSGNFAMLPGATRNDTLAMMRELQRAAEKVGTDYATEYGTNPVDYIIAEIGGGSGRGLSSADTKAPELLGAISIELIDPDFRPYSSFQFVAALQEEVRAHPMMEELSFRGWRSGPGGDALSVELYGAAAEDLKAAAEALKAALQPFPEVSALEDNLAYDKDELILDLTPQGQALGFSIDALGRVLRDRLNGIEAATFPDGPRSAAIRLELPDSELTADFLDRTLMRTAAGQYVPLADIVTVERRSGFSTVRRQSGLRVVTVTGDLAEDDPARAAEIQRLLKDEILPRIETEYNVSVRQSGLAQQESDFLGDATLGLGFCLIGIYLVLAWIFASWVRPMVVMSVIPFGLVGAIYGHVLWEIPLSMFSIVGLIGMTGIIINDSIVLVSTIDEYSHDRGLFPAIVDAVVDRLRPVLLTTLTTVLGLAPLLYESSSQALFLKPTVVSLVYGLGFGLVLVLMVVPALTAMQFDVARQFRALRRALQVRRAARGVAVTVGLATLAVAGLFAATMGPVLFGDALPPVWHVLVPGLADVAAMKAAFGLFVTGAAAITILAALFGRLVLWLGRSQGGRAVSPPGNP